MSEQIISDNHILYEDNHLIGVYKESGVLVQGDKTRDLSLVDSLGNYLKAKYNKPGNVFVGLIHRIDRPVSGLVLFSKTSKGLSRMNKVFQERKVEKTYWCIVQGKVNRMNGHLEHYLQKDAAKNKARVSEKEKAGYKKAELTFNVLEVMQNFSLLEIKPKTGRHHQIRAQLAKMGHPIKGDLKYGAKRSNEDGSICLHSRSLSFEHPIKKEQIHIHAPLPESDLWTKITN